MCTLALILSATLLVGDVRGQESPPPPPPPPAAAERLFAEGRELFASGKLEEACARFDASHKLQPTATGPLVNLALCNEQLGRYATAARLYRDVITKTRGIREERAAYAEQRVREVEPRVSTLRIVVPQAVRDVRVVLDGVALVPAAWNIELPVDGGSHRIEASAPGRARISREVVVQVERDRAVIDLASLAAPEASLVSAEPGPPVTPQDQAPDHTLAFVVGGVGLGLFVVGAGLGTSVAAECGGFFKSVCDGPNQKTTLEERESALRAVETRAWLANVGVIAGLVGLGSGTYLYLSKSTRRDKRGVWLAPTGGGLVVDGAF